jgi:tetratricopeptide (TPR) repeat protein
MKKVIILLLFAFPLVLMAQKPIKPNLNKALNSWKQGKLDEAKQMIDVCVDDPKLSLDAKTWYYQGLIYASIDTTSNSAYKNLSGNAFDTSMKAFAKADELNKNSKSELFYTDEMGLPVLRSQSMLFLAGYYMNAGATAFQDDNNELAVQQFEKTMKVTPNDTTAYFYGGYVSQVNEDYDKAITYLNKYNELGGRSADAYTLLLTIYSGPKNDKEKALALVREAKAKYPNNQDFPLVEIGYLIDLNMTDQARGGLEAAVKNDPGNKTLHFYLGYVNSKLEKWDDAKKNFNDAMKIDPLYFDAQYYLAQIYFIEADKVKREMNNLGITDADKKKRLELDKQLVDKYKIALPYWEKAEKLNPSDADVLDKLSVIYYYLGDEKNEKRISQRMKELGLDN